MRKSLTVLLAAALVTGALLAPSADAAKKKKKPKKKSRTVSQTYQAPALGAGAGICLKPTNSCAETATSTNDKYVMIEIVDTTGLPISGGFGQEMDGELGVENYQAFCGKTPKPVKIEPGYPITVFPWVAPNAGCAGVATTGTVKLTFSNLP